MLYINTLSVSTCPYQRQNYLHCRAWLGATKRTDGFNWFDLHTNIETLKYLVATFETDNIMRVYQLIMNQYPASIIFTNLSVWGGGNVAKISENMYRLVIRLWNTAETENEFKKWEKWMNWVAALQTCMH